MACAAVDHCSPAITINGSLTLDQTVKRVTLQLGQTPVFLSFFKKELYLAYVCPLQNLPVSGTFEALDTFTSGSWLSSVLPEPTWESHLAFYFYPFWQAHRQSTVVFIWFLVMSNQVTDPDFYLISGHVYFPNRSISSNLLAIFKLVNLGFFFFTFVYFVGRRGNTLN